MEPIKMNYPPSMVLNYAKKLRDHNSGGKVNPAQKAMMDDFVTMIEIAAGVMKQEDKPIKNKKNGK